MNKKQVFEIIVSQSPPVDTKLILAIAEQESTFDETAVRMENGFYDRYIRHRTTFATTSSVLLSTSYGLMQMLGESLLEVGYFEFFKDYANAKAGFQVIMDARSQIGITKGIDEYMLHPDWHIKTGIQHFTKKLGLAHSNIETALQYWNGGGNALYSKEVMARWEKFNTDVDL